MPPENSLLIFVLLNSNSDTTPPNVTCDDVTTRPFLPNSFLGLSVGVSYTYEDSNPDPSGITYNVTKGPGGDLFPPGRTPVTMYAVDLHGNRATCLFYVENTLTKLPVNCPDLNKTVATDMGLPTYSYTPSIEASDVTKSTFGYRYHGGAVSVDPTMAIGSKLDVGTHLDTVLISDEVLSKTCIGYIVVQDTTPPNVTCDDVTTRPFLPNSFLGLNVGVSYTYEDSNPDPSGITYNVTKGADGDLFPPGQTPVTMYAVDLHGNRATCLFYVENTLTELPVNCPDLSRTVATDIGLPTYSYTPSIEASDVTKSTSGYRYHGGAVSVDPTMAIGSKLDVGTHPDTVLISDEVLSKTCIGFIVVQGRLFELRKCLTYLNDNHHNDNTLADLLGGGGDKEDPVFSYCPLALTVIPAQGDAAANVGWIKPIVSDNSGSFSLFYNITREMNNTNTNTGNGLSFEIGSYLNAKVIN
eukprot:XP_011664434.1 PREDICTED: uncharacterized protein LOC105438390 [Strongylocentrotus purpuratus]